MKGFPPILKRIPFLLGITPVFGNREIEKIIYNT
jgi:hypothetical protein